MSRSKHNNQWTEVDGIRFQSKLEAERYWQLKQLAKQGEISHLELQVPFGLQSLSGADITTYKADFVYVDKEAGKLIVEDAKGFETDVFRIKWKWVQADFKSDRNEFRLFKK